MDDCITTDARMTFDPEALRATVSGGDFEHSQMTDGPFRGHLMGSHSGGSILDMGT